MRGSVGEEVETLAGDSGEDMYLILMPEPWVRARADSDINCCLEVGAEPKFR